MIARSISSLLVGSAVLLASVSACDPVKSPPRESGLDQNWSAKTQSEWYWTSQGSRLLPLAWFNALEQAGNEQLFRERAHLESFKYVYSSAAGAPDRPIGFAVDDQVDDKLSVTKLRWKAQQGNREPWIGLTCAACHTAELSYQGKAIRVDGGPTFADFQSFLEALNASLAATASSDEKFDRFAVRVLGGQPSAADKAQLRGALNRLTQWQLDLATMNQTPLRYGYGRLDAFGHIYNKVARVAAGVQTNGNPSDAPVSYPFLWNVPQLDKVQWNGIAKNEAVKLPLVEPFELGALGRNAGEVIGVFADVKAAPGVSLAGYTSSVRVINLDLLERALKSLRPPRWPSEMFGEINADLRAQGKTLFVQRCQACHEFLDRKNLTKEIKAKNVRLAQVGSEAPIGTDPWMACNAYLYQADAGLLTGTPSRYVSGVPLKSRAGLAEMLGTMVAGTLVGEKGDVIRAALRSFFDVKRVPTVAFAIEGEAARDPRAPALTQCEFAARNVDILGYQSRPLTGVWASAPYLHNGSVPTLYDLLLPPAQRPTTFFVGSREFDPKKVGLAQPQDGAGLFKFQAKNADGSDKPGNSNAGHDYGSASFTEQQRQALVEYMKSL